MQKVPKLPERMQARARLGAARKEETEEGEAVTIHEIETSTKEVLTPQDVCEVLHCKPFTLNVTAKGGMLKIPHSFVGNRLKFPRQAFLNWFYGNPSYPFWTQGGEVQITTVRPAIK